MGADDDVIEADDCREHAHGKNDRKRCETGRDKCQPKHVSFASTPIAVKQCGGALPINIARPMHACRTSLGHRYEREVSIELTLPCQLRLDSPLPISAD